MPFTGCPNRAVNVLDRRRRKDRESRQQSTSARYLIDMLRSSMAEVPTIAVDADINVTNEQNNQFFDYLDM
jgi:hypothetical protein